MHSKATPLIRTKAMMTMTANVDDGDDGDAILAAAAAAAAADPNIVL